MASASALADPNDLVPIRPPEYELPEKLIPDTNISLSQYIMIKNEFIRNKDYFVN